MLLLRPLITRVHQLTQLRLKLMNQPTICGSRSRFTWSRQSRKFTPLKKAALTTVLSATCFVGFYQVHINYGPPQDPSAKKWLGEEIEDFFPSVAEDFILFFALIVLIVTGRLPSMFRDRIKLIPTIVITGRGGLLCLFLFYSTF